MKIGLLYPRSQSHPGMMADFVDGFKTAIQYHQIDGKVQLISESIGFGGVEKEVYEKVEKLLMLENADVLVAFIDLRILDLIKPLIFASGKLVLVVNPGANYPQNWIPQSNILYLTLHHGFLCWLTGKLAAQMINKNAATATTFYDCGYLHIAAMVKGFVMNGGQITYNYVNNQCYDDTFEIKQLTDYLITDRETNNLLCIFDSHPASLFYSRLNTCREAERLHLFASPMMLENKAREHLNEELKFTVEGYLPWYPSLENNANRDFMISYKQQINRIATVFSILGWESGLILREVFLQSNENYSDGSDIIGKLAESKINSPRGNMKLDRETNHLVAPVYNCSVAKNSAKCTLSVLENLETEWNAFVQIPTEGVSSGWTNTYLCY